MKKNLKKFTILTAFTTLAATYVPASIYTYAGQSPAVELNFDALEVLKQNKKAEDLKKKENQQVKKLSNSKRIIKPTLKPKNHQKEEKKIKKKKKHAKKHEKKNSTKASISGKNKKVDSSITAKQIIDSNVINEEDSPFSKQLIANEKPILEKETKQNATENEHNKKEEVKDLTLPPVEDDLLNKTKKNEITKQNKLPTKTEETPKINNNNTNIKNNSSLPAIVIKKADEMEDDKEEQPTNIKEEIQSKKIDINNQKPEKDTVKDSTIKSFVSKFKDISLFSKKEKPTENKADTKNKTIANNNSENIANPYNNTKTQQAKEEQPEQINDIPIISEQDIKKEKSQAKETSKQAKKRKEIEKREKIVIESPKHDIKQEDISKDTPENHLESNVISTTPEKIEQKQSITQNLPKIEEKPIVTQDNKTKTEQPSEIRSILKENHTENKIGSPTLKLKTKSEEKPQDTNKILTEKPISESEHPVLNKDMKIVTKEQIASTPSTDKNSSWLNNSWMGSFFAKKPVDDLTSNNNTKNAENIKPEEVKPTPVEEKKQVNITNPSDIKLTKKDDSNILEKKNKQEVLSKKIEQKEPLQSANKENKGVDSAPYITLQKEELKQPEKSNNSVRYVESEDLTSPTKPETKDPVINKEESKNLASNLVEKMPAFQASENNAKIEPSVPEIPEFAQVIKPIDSTNKVKLNIKEKETKEILNNSTEQKLAKVIDSKIISPQSVEPPVPDASIPMQMAEITPPKDAPLLTLQDAGSKKEEKPQNTKSTSQSSKSLLISVTFEGNGTSLTPSDKERLNKLVQQILPTNKRIKVLSFAQGVEGEINSARRVALQRAITVRSEMIKYGLEKTRINVQAVGNNPEEQEFVNSVNIYEAD